MCPIIGGTKYDVASWQILFRTLAKNLTISPPPPFSNSGSRCVKLSAIVLAGPTVLSGRSFALRMMA
jgi:hypothetical protein